MVAAIGRLCSGSAPHNENLTYSKNDIPTKAMIVNRKLSSRKITLKILQYLLI